ncbi:hypothetical protein AMK59_5461, partial [Oryctes borbonicus]
MSFGFRKRPVSSSYTGNPVAARRLASADIDRNGNNGDTEPLTANAVPSGRTTPRLAPPKKEPNASRVSRFGFRQTNANRLNKIADINAVPSPAHIECTNNNLSGMRVKSAFTEKVTSPVDSNKNSDQQAVFKNVQNQINPTKFTLQTSSLPKPQYPVHVVESKTAKTLVNTNRKVTTTLQQQQQQNQDETSSKDGSLTEDSGVGSHLSTNNHEGESTRCAETLNESPTYGTRIIRQKQRTLDVVVTGNTFDVRDFDDANEPVIPLPRLPSAFQTCNTGIVRERALEYERNIDRTRRKISLTSSDGDAGEEEKTMRENYRTEKTTFVSKPTPIKSFLKSTRHGFHDSSPPSSDDQLWGNAGEAMADEFSCSFSSSDESKDKEQAPIIAQTNNTVADAFETLMNASLTNSLPKNEIRSVLLTIEDPKFAAVAAASKSSILLDDETSPTDSLVCSYSESQEEYRKKMNQSSSTSKDINEKVTLSPSSPGTPTNASNSLSLSDGKDFLIDDEIADQPALVFDETLTGCNSDNTQQNSENNTLVESTPKVKRKALPAFDQSPLMNRNRKTFLSRTDSVETLSTCESIASDDLMMDYDVSQGSGVDDTFDRSDKRSSLYLSEDSGKIMIECGKNESREWSSLFGNLDKALPKHVSRTSRLLRSRGGTPNSNPDSPRSIEGGRVHVRSRSSVSQSPLRLSRVTLASSAGGYDSDDSIKLDRTCHSAMVQEVMGMKTMLLKLKRVLHEQADEDLLLRSETHNPFDLHKNGLFNGLSSETDSLDTDDSTNSRLELEDLKRQVLFLQGQVEDREKTVQELQEQMSKLINENYISKSAPASTISTETCNAATQTERTRPISAGPSLLQTSPAEGSMTSLVSASETPTRRSRL